MAETKYLGGKYAPFQTKKRRYINRILRHYESLWNQYESIGLTRRRARPKSLGKEGQGACVEPQRAGDDRTPPDWRTNFALQGASSSC